MTSYTTAYLAKNENTQEYIWRSDWGIGGTRNGVAYVVVDVPSPADLRYVDKITPTNLTLDEKIFWINQHDMEIYVKHHNRFMNYRNNYTCVELRKIINEWNNKRPINDKIKGVYKMKREELIKIAEGGKYQ